MKTELLGVRLPLELCRAVETFAEEFNVSKSDIMRDSLRRYFRDELGRRHSEAQSRIFLADSLGEMISLDHWKKMKKKHPETIQDWYRMLGGLLESANELNDKTGRVAEALLEKIGA